SLFQHRHPPQRARHALHPSQALPCRWLPVPRRDRPPGRCHRREQHRIRAQCRARVPKTLRLPRGLEGQDLGGRVLRAGRASLRDGLRWTDAFRLLLRLREAEGAGDQESRLDRRVHPPRPEGRDQQIRSDLLGLGAVAAGGKSGSMREGRREGDGWVRVMTRGNEGARRPGRGVDRP
ncbi:hypothetical protein Naga_100268g12, partial [Nannochloropsis gaditana]